MGWNMSKKKPNPADTLPPSEAPTPPPAEGVGPESAAAAGITQFTPPEPGPVERTARLLAENKIPWPESETKPAATPPGTRDEVKGLYRVELLHCTPLVDGRQQKFMEIEAASAEEAWEKFRAHNGIVKPGSPPTVTRIQ